MLAPGAEFVVFLKNRDISITITFTADPSIMEYHQGLTPNNICTSCFMEHFYILNFTILEQRIKRIVENILQKKHNIKLHLGAENFHSLVFKTK